MYEHVYKFNAVRNQFAFDINTEVKLYEEEVQEFFTAKTFGERVDAYVDCVYVRLGTEMKMAAAGKTISPYANRESLMYSILESEFATGFHPYEFNGLSCGDYGKLAEIIKKAQKIVCDANAMKPYELDENGKVIKDEKVMNATVLIHNMIQSVIADV